MKLTTSLPLALLTAGLLAGRAAQTDETLPLLEIGGKTYTNVTVINVTATDIYFSYAGGVGNAKLQRLSPELQKHFNFNARNATIVERQQKEGNAQYRLGLAAGKGTAASATFHATSTVKDDGGPDPIAQKLYAKAFRGQKAPQLVVEKWLTEKPDLAGKFVLIDFWATWCRPCRDAIPHLNDFYAKYGDRMVVIGLSDEPVEDIRSMKSPKIDYAVATDTQGRTSKAVGVTGIPHTMLIDPNGIVRFEGMPGYLDEPSLSRLLARYGTNSPARTGKVAKAK